MLLGGTELGKFCAFLFFFSVFKIGFPRHSMQTLGRHLISEYSGKKQNCSQKKRALKFLKCFLQRGLRDSLLVSGQLPGVEK